MREATVAHGLSRIADRPPVKLDGYTVCANRRPDNTDREAGNVNQEPVKADGEPVNANLWLNNTVGELRRPNREPVNLDGEAANVTR